MEILGVNGVGDEPYNSQVTQVLNVLPWLQDTTAQQVWTSWGISYRDVLVLDAFNRPIGRDNLTSHDLGVAANFDALKRALLGFATPADTDRDGLLDDWEYGWYGSLAPKPDDDPDLDGADHFAEMAFATNPTEAPSRPSLRPLVARPAGNPALAVIFHRFSGSFVDFVVETSPDLVTWTASPSSIVRSGTVRNLFDGLGGAETRYQQTSAAGARPAGFIRVRPLPRGN